MGVAGIGKHRLEEDEVEKIRAADAVGKGPRCRRAALRCAARLGRGNRLAATKADKEKLALHDAYLDCVKKNPG